MTASRNPGQGQMPLITRLDQGIRALSHGMVLVSGWGILLMGLLVTADVLWRAATGRNFGGVDEIASYVFAIGISWSLSSAFHARAHIRVDLLYRKLPFVSRVAIDLMAILSLLIVAAFLCYSSWLVLDTSFSRGARSASTLQVPLVIPQALWVFGVAVFSLSLVTAFARGLVDIGTSNAIDIVARHGVLGADEEARHAVSQSSEKAR